MKRAQLCRNPMIEEDEEKRTVVFLTPFRNAAGVVVRYFEQVNKFAENHKDQFDVKVIALEGDSQDGTRRLIEQKGHEFCLNIALYVVDVSHGKQIVWKSVEDPIRLETMGRIMDQGIAAVVQMDHEIIPSDIIVWIMSDLDFEPSDIRTLIDGIPLVSSVYENVMSPMVMSGDKFYDTWAYRSEGARFTPSSPYHHSLEKSGEERYIELDSAGSCLVMLRSVLDRVQSGPEEAVSFCNNARSQGVSIWLDRETVIYHGQDHVKAGPRPKLLYVGYFFKPFSYARLAHALVSKLAETFEITILAIGYNGDPHDLPYQVWPSGVDVAKKLGTLLKEVSPDVIILHDETYGITKLAKALRDYPLDKVHRPFVFAWTEIEGIGQCAKFNDYSEIDTYIVPTRFAVTEVEKATKAGIVKVNHGVDTSIFNVRTLEERLAICKSCEGFTDETIVFGVVCVNQMRKRIDLALRAFAALCAKSPSTDMKMIIVTRNVPGGYDLKELCTRLGILEKVSVLYDQYSDYDLSALMNVFDVFVSTSIGEGWCLAAHEALACGARLVVPNHSGFLEWCSIGCAEDVIKNPLILMVDSDNIEPLSPVNELVYVDGMGVNFDDLVYKMGLAVEDVLAKRPYRRSDIQIKQSDEMGTIVQLIIDRLESRKDTA